MCAQTTNTNLEIFERIWDCVGSKQWDVEVGPPALFRTKTKTLTQSWMNVLRRGTNGITRYPLLLNMLQRHRSSITFMLLASQNENYYDLKAP